MIHALVDAITAYELVEFCVNRIHALLVLVALPGWFFKVTLALLPLPTWFFVNPFLYEFHFRITPLPGLFEAAQALRPVWFDVNPFTHCHCQPYYPCDSSSACHSTVLLQISRHTLTQLISRSPWRFSLLAPSHCHCQSSSSPPGNPSSWQTSFSVPSR